MPWTPIPKQLDWPLDRMQLNLRQSAEPVGGFKNVSKHVAQKFTVSRRGIKRQLARLVPVSQGPQIVDAEDVVGVRMCVKHRIELRNVFP